VALRGKIESPCFDFKEPDGKEGGSIKTISLPSLGETIDGKSTWFKLEGEDNFWTCILFGADCLLEDLVFLLNILVLLLRPFIFLLYCFV
jgi:hypothetical protein